MYHYNVSNINKDEIGSMDLDMLLFQSEEERILTKRNLEHYIHDFLLSDFIRICDVCIGKQKEFPKSFIPYLESFGKFIQSNGYKRKMIFNIVNELHKMHTKNFFVIEKVFREFSTDVLPMKKETTKAGDGITLNTILNHGDFFRFAIAIDSDISHEGFFDKNLLHERIVDIVCVLTFLELLYG